MHLSLASPSMSLIECTVRGFAVVWHDSKSYFLHWQYGENEDECQLELVVLD